MSDGRHWESDSTRIDLAHAPSMRVAGIEMEPQRRIVRSGGTETVVEPRVMQVLLALARARGAVLTREELIESCWGGRIVGDDSIHQVISKIRKLGGASGTGIPVETVRGIGYRLAVEPEAQARPRFRGARRIGLPVLALLSLAGVAVLAQSSGVSRDEPPKAVSLAILPFSDLSETGRGHFAEGVAEEILDRLSEEPGLRVAGRSSAAMLGPQPSFEEARERLGVTHLLEGSVRLGGGRVRMSVRLLRTSDGMQVWTEQFDRGIDDIFAIQDEVGAAVASRLRGTLAAYPTARSQARRTSSEVYDLYLAANQLAWSRTYEKMTQAQRLLQRAVEIDPNYAPAWARLAVNSTIIDQVRPSGMYQDGPAEKARTLRYAKRALALQPDLAEAHAALAMTIMEDNPEAAVAAHQRSIELDPGLFLAWNNLGNAYKMLCKPKLALASFKRAASIEPLLFVPRVNIVDLLSEMGRDAEAEQEIHRYLAISRDPLEAQRLPARLAYFRGDLSSAVIHGQRARKLHPANPSIRTFLAFSLDAAGHTADALSILPASQRQTLGNFWQERYMAVSSQARPGMAAFWDQGTRFFAVSKALIRTGQASRLLELFDARFRSVDAFDRQFRCNLPGAATMPILALRQAGRRQEAEQLLRKAVARFNEGSRAGYSYAERDVLRAELLILQGESEQALGSLEVAVARGWMNQNEPFIGLSDPVFDPVRDHPRFKAVVQRIETRRERERHQLRAEMAAAERGRRA